MERRPRPGKRWRRRFWLLLAGFVVVILVVGTAASEDNFLVFYHPVFFLFGLGVAALSIGHDLAVLREPDPLGEGASGKLASFGPLSKKGVLGFSRGILKARIAAAVVILLVVIPEAGAALWRLFAYLF